MKTAALLLSLLLAGCTLAPEGTNMDRIYRSLHHPDHPEYGGPITQAEQHADFTGTHPGISVAARSAVERDMDTCEKELPKQPRELSVSEHVARARRHLWMCLWAKGWRWDTDAPPTP